MRMKVLVADGSPLIQVRIESILSELPDVQVTGCVAEVEGMLDLIAAQQPDVVILDASLPHGGCLRLLRRIGSRAGAGGPLVIVLASPKSLTYRRKLREAGAALVFDKVRDMDRVVKAISSLRAKLSKEKP
jgi:DNA-binding NarL/FixJ family response regulator